MLNLSVEVVVSLLLVIVVQFVQTPESVCGGVCDRGHYILLGQGPHGQCRGPGNILEGNQPTHALSPHCLAFSCSRGETLVATNIFYNDG